MDMFERCIRCIDERAGLCKPYREIAGIRPKQTPAARLDSDTALEAFTLFESLLALRLGEIGCAHYSPREADSAPD